KLGRNILGNAGQAQDMDVEPLPSCARRFEIFTAVMPQTEVKALAGYRLLDHIGVSFKLVSDRRSDEVGSVGVEPFMHHQVDVAEVDIAEVDGDFLAVARFRAQLVYRARHLYAILLPSSQIVSGVPQRLFQGRCPEIPKI